MYTYTYTYIHTHKHVTLKVVLWTNVQKLNAPKCKCEDGTDHAAAEGPCVWGGGAQRRVRPLLLRWLSGQRVQGSGAVVAAHGSAAQRLDAAAGPQGQGATRDPRLLLVPLLVQRKPPR